jgi:hypothetical protein
MRVLLLGVEQAGFVCQLVSGLKDSEPSLEVYTLPLRGFSSKVDHAIDRVFDRIIWKRLTFGSLKYWICHLPRLAQGVLQSGILTLLGVNEGRASLSATLKGYVTLGLIAHVDFSRLDVVSIHYCSLQNLILAWLLPKTRIVLSFWGSDLFRTSGPALAFWGPKALARAARIQVCTPEMGDVILSKYGREFHPKLRYALFLPDAALIDSIDRLRSDQAAQEALRRQLGVEPGKILVTVGHNGMEDNNHLRILESIEQGMADTSQLVFVLPLTYMLTEGYLERLVDFKRRSRLRLILLTEYLKADELALFRLVSQIMIMMPTSDAMSAAFTETLYGGNIGIAAAWLPYGKLRREEVFCLTLEAFQELAPALQRILADPESFTALTKNNPQHLRNCYYHKPTLCQSWLRILSEP